MAARDRTRSTPPRTIAEEEARFSRRPVGDPADPRMGPAGRPPRGSAWRETVAAASGINLIAGIWLIIAPFVLGYSNGDPYWNDIVFGAIIAVFALARVSGAYRAAWLSWLNALIGVWLFISAFWLDATATAGINDVILGIVVFVLGIASATATEEAMTGGPPPPGARTRATTTRF
jgi:SPW repeat-containing protein